MAIAKQTANANLPNRVSPLSMQSGIWAFLYLYSDLYYQYLNLVPDSRHKLKLQGLSLGRFAMAETLLLLVCLHAMIQTLVQLSNNLVRHGHVFFPVKEDGYYFKTLQQGGW